MKPGGQDDASDEEENGIDDVEGERDGWVGEIVLDGGEDQVEEGEQRKDRDKHGVIDRRGVSAYRLVDHVSHKSHYEQCPQELPRKT